MRSKFVIKLDIGSNVRMCQIDAEEAQSQGERSEQQTAETMVMRATGDWVRRDDSGEVWFVERRDKQVKRWGRKMCLRSIEQVAILVCFSLCVCFCFSSAAKSQHEF